MRVETDELPWIKILKKAMPEIYDPEWQDMSLFELLDGIVETEPLKVMLSMASWYNGPRPSWRGTGIFGLICNLLAH